MSASWREDDEELKVGGVKGGSRLKPRFSFNEVKLLLEAVKRNRFIILRKFNQGVSPEAKKQTWAEITNQINSLGENHREVRQIMKKWADLKCDGKRRAIALRSPNGSIGRKKNLGPVERMVNKILMMSPRGGGDSDLDFGDDEDFSKLYSKGPPTNPPSYSYLSLTDSTHSIPGGAPYDLSPLSSPEKELGGGPFCKLSQTHVVAPPVNSSTLLCSIAGSPVCFHKLGAGRQSSTAGDTFHSSSDFDLADDGDGNMDFEENDDAMFSSYPPSLPPPSSTSLDPLPDNVLLRMKPVHTYSRNNSQNHTSPRPSSSVAVISSVFPSVSDSDAASSSAAPPPSQSPPSSNMTASPLPAPSSSFTPPPSSSSTSVAANTCTPQPAPPSSSIPPPPGAPTLTTAVSSSSAASTATSSSNSHEPSPSSSVLPPNRPSTSGSNQSDPLPAGASSRRAHDHVAQMASQGLQQQRASRMLLTSVSQSLEILAQSVQLLVESQQEFVQESLTLQRETVDILRDFSNTALTMLRDKSNSGQLATHHHHHPTAHF
ncbi:serine-rich adhesin for platelets-like isoform X2 [Anoplopoma fimbria]|uniref:serine-rich adhesin for platelets-like isoform X2 n=1 Tax=Anoplopoma fimbria TaxID=229290 RepID=UPI0023EE2563|nr:serine-rich adhesin for platelets-like isoform X2 [Anoplopoma fimbria]